jgi:hypothetical protein
MKSESLELIREGVRRQRTPSASRIRRTWERPTSTPMSRAATANASRVTPPGRSRRAAPFIGVVVGPLMKRRSPPSSG